jgi:nicotinamidase-related amidase
MPWEERMRQIDVHGRYYRMFPPQHYAGQLEEDFSVDFDRSALLVVDIYGHGFPAEQAGQDHPSMDAEKNRPWDEITLGYIRPALEAARSAKLPVIYAHNSSPNVEIQKSQLGKQLGRSLGTDLADLLAERPGLLDPLEYSVRPGARLLDIAPAVAPKPGDYFVRKHFYSGFKDTRLDTLLRNLDVRTLFCAGFDASVCLLCTLIDAFELDYQVILLRDAVRAIEIPEDEAIGYSFTNRMITWIETMIGRSITTEHFCELMVMAARDAKGIRGSEM